MLHRRNILFVLTVSCLMTLQTITSDFSLKEEIGDACKDIEKITKNVVSQMIEITSYNLSDEEMQKLLQCQQYLKQSVESYVCNAIETKKETLATLRKTLEVFPR